MSQEEKRKSRIILANNVKNLRTKNGYTSQELSLILGFDNSYISKVENANMNITIDKLDAIANFFNTDTRSLFQ